MTLRVFYTILITIAFSSSLSAQKWSQRKYEFYYGAGLVNFMGDIGAVPDQRIWVQFWETVSPTGNVGLRYNYNERHYFTGTMFLGQMFATDHAKGYQTRQHTFNSFFTELSVKYEFMIWQEKRKRAVYRKLGESQLKNISIPTYLFTGIGGIMNVGTTTRPKVDHIATEPYFNVAPTLQFGLGFKYKVGKFNYINLEASYRLALSDKLDGSSGKDHPGHYGEWFDEYQTITVNYIHKLKANRNGWPKFKKR